MTQDPFHREAKRAQRQCMQIGQTTSRFRNHVYQFHSIIKNIFKSSLQRVKECKPAVVIEKLFLGKLHIYLNDTFSVGCIWFNFNPISYQYMGSNWTSSISGPRSYFHTLNEPWFSEQIITSGLQVHGVFQPLSLNTLHTGRPSQDGLSPEVFP